MCLYLSVSFPSPYPRSLPRSLALPLPQRQNPQSCAVCKIFRPMFSTLIFYSDDLNSINWYTNAMSGVFDCWWNPFMSGVHVRLRLIVDSFTSKTALLPPCMDWFTQSHDNCKYMLMLSFPRCLRSSLFAYVNVNCSLTQIMLFLMVHSKYNILSVFDVFRKLRMYMYSERIA